MLFSLPMLEDRHTVHGGPSPQSLRDSGHSETSPRQGDWKPASRPLENHGAEQTPVAL